METIKKLTGACMIALPLLLSACGDDKPAPAPGGDGDGNEDGNADGDEDGSADGDEDGSADGDEDGSADGDEDGNADGNDPEECDLSGAGKDYEVVPNPTGTFTLTSDKNWTIQGITYVEEGDTLTIDPCTRIEGAPLTGGEPSVLVVQRGAKIQAAGTAEQPILFTGERLDESDPHEPGLWGGIILLGRATNNSGTDVLVEGLEDDAKNKHGGDDDEDNSGTLTYVRIEDGGYELATDVEVNGITFGSVGSGTTVHHVMVVNNQDDCFEWFGGTVNASHLIAEGCGDDMFDVDLGYRGTLEKLLGRQKSDVVSSSNPNGFECDNNPAGPAPTPLSDFTANEVTLCGVGSAVSATAYGAVLRRGVHGSLDQNVIVGFNEGVSIRDASGTPADPYVTLANSSFFGNFSQNIGVIHTDTNPDFDPVDWFEMGDNNSEPDPAPFTVADCQAADGPSAAVTGSGIGAFASEDNWATGLWVEWSTFE